MIAKIRKVECYHPLSGTWYKLQIKFLFIWWDLPLQYSKKDMCCQMMRIGYIDELFSKPLMKVEDSKYIECRFANLLRINRKVKKTNGQGFGI